VSAGDELRAVQRDASFFNGGRLNTSRTVQYWPVWHLATDDGHHTRCGLPADQYGDEDPSLIPVVRRCRRSGCRQAWAALPSEEER
jgi:hypothetical protein